MSHPYMYDRSIFYQLFFFSAVQHFSSPSELPSGMEINSSSLDKVAYPNSDSFHIYTHFQTIQYVRIASLTLE